ncbi:protein phosphatase 2C [Heterostelium album PN500]|uniref:Protein phosphatase 2C n=1 Tax=Heterostelium pallidum (strain ATCC 26659 / Pp 5 / PN500) TaxID=670386 RepID=D3B1R8_HETP5|nr:protein phosphatase 2C [Heterostelium album PN500]EFA85242.1 protein phosphatase 2C [Heterostelium album PN500]|eukprot:XP_020437351.1 protein phosphatase 2C [Heterostelium album PN500]
MGNVLDKAKDAGEPTNHDAFVFWYNLKEKYEHSETLLDHFQPFMVDHQYTEQEDNDGGGGGGGGGTTNLPITTTTTVNTTNTTQNNNSQHQHHHTRNGSGGEGGTANGGVIAGRPTSGSMSEDSYVMLGTVKGDARCPSPTSSSIISTTPKSEQLNRNLLQTINCKLQLIPPELNHFTLNLDNHYLTEKMVLSICATIISNNENYHNRHLTTTHKETPINTMRKKKLQSDDVRAYDEGAFMIAAFLMTTKSLRTIDLSTNHITDKGYEALRQAALRNTSVTSIYLSDNSIDAAKLYSLSNILKRNTSIQYVMDSIFDRLTLSRKFKNKLQSFKKGVMQVRSNSTLNFNADQDDKTPLFRLMGKQNQQIPVPEQMPSNRYIVGKSETIGKRSSMEDRMVAYGRFGNVDDCELYSIFDGHGGKAASDYAADNIYRIFSDFLAQTNQPDEAFKQSYQAIHAHISPWPFIGTTAASVYIKDSLATIANVGDSRVVLGYINEHNQFAAERLTFDHRPVEDTERQRIINAGGSVLNGRVNGMLAVSRALGDSFLTPYVTPDPYISHLTISEKCKFLILACDGVWDLISDEEAVKVISSIPDPAKSSETLRDLAFAQGSTDNISVMIVKLNEY